MKKNYTQQQCESICKKFGHVLAFTRDLHTVYKASNIHTHNINSNHLFNNGSHLLITWQPFINPISTCENVCKVICIVH